MTAELPELPQMRQEYESALLDETDLAPDWPTQFDRWLADAVAAGEPEPNAMVLATADRAGRPSARTVLLKGYDHRGFVCYTNLESRKAKEVRANPYASLVFGWRRLHRQVVVAGAVTELAREEVAAYFAARPRGAQLAAWASPQSQVIGGRDVLDRAYAAVAGRFPGPVPPPPHWGGLRIVPDSVEFWLGRPDRRHDRLRFHRIENGNWIVERLAP